MAGVLRYRARTAAQGCLFPSLGNLERNNQQYYELFNVSTPYYSFHGGTAHFIVLNNDIGNISTSEMARDSFWAEQTRWLEKRSPEEPAADFRFVIAHRPPLTAVARRHADNPHMTALMPMFEKYKTAGRFSRPRSQLSALSEERRA